MPGLISLSFTVTIKVICKWHEGSLKPDNRVKAYRRDYCGQKDQKATGRVKRPDTISVAGQVWQITDNAVRSLQWLKLLKKTQAVNVCLTKKRVISVSGRGQSGGKRKAKGNFVRALVGVYMWVYLWVLYSFLSLFYILDVGKPLFDNELLTGGVIDQEKRREGVGISLWGVQVCVCGGQCTVDGEQT